MISNLQTAQLAMRERQPLPPARVKCVTCKKTPATHGAKVANCAGCYAQIKGRQCVANDRCNECRAVHIDCRCKR